MNIQLKHLSLLLTIGLFIFFTIASTDSKSNSIQPNQTSNHTEIKSGGKDSDCLINIDWCYPNCSNPKSAWKFSSDGTFNYSTTAFGGMSAWGNWVENGNGAFRINYTKTTEGTIPNEQIIELQSCNYLKVGSTIYTH